MVVYDKDERSSSVIEGCETKRRMKYDFDTGDITVGMSQKAKAIHQYHEGKLNQSLYNVSTNVPDTKVRAS